MRSNAAAIQSFQKLINTEFTLEKGHLVPGTIKELEKESILFKLKKYFRRKEAEQRIEEKNVEKTKEIVDRIVNLKLDINSMSSKTIPIDSKTMSKFIKFMEPTMDIQKDLKETNPYMKMIKFYLKLSTIKDFNFLSTDEVLDYLLILDELKKYIVENKKTEESVLDYLFLLNGSKKSRCDDPKMNGNIVDGIEQLKLKLISTLGSKMIEDMKHLNERTAYFIKLQETCTLDTDTVKISVDKLLDKHTVIESSYKKYLMPALEKDNRMFDYTLFEELFNQIEEKIYILLEPNKVGKEEIIEFKK